MISLSVKQEPFRKPNAQQDAQSPPQQLQSFHGLGNQAVLSALHTPIPFAHQEPAQPRSGLHEDGVTGTGATACAPRRAFHQAAQPANPSVAAQ